MNVKSYLTQKNFRTEIGDFHKTKLSLRSPFGAYNSCYPTRLHTNPTEVGVSDQQRTLGEICLLTYGFPKCFLHGKFDGLQTATKKQTKATTSAVWHPRLQRDDDHQTGILATSKLCVAYGSWPRCALPRKQSGSDHLTPATRKNARLAFFANSLRELLAANCCKTSPFWHKFGICFDVSGWR